ncbi:MAG: HD-GYP domain-containing protein, partial [Pirellulaceae bacterium]
LGDTVDKSFKTRSKGRYITSGDCPLDEDEFMQLVESLHIDASSGPHVCNERITATDDWAFPDVRQLIAVPLVEGENVFGWIAAFNHSSGHSFGTVEANLIASLGTLLGIHSGNRELYRQQSELLADIVRALVSAIDAKDPYTSGHSDRVARFAVRIALEMRCSPKFVNTIYMAGLLHDVGKIGIDDNVLRKAGRLTDTEFEHIKKHPELGYRILADLKPLSDVLPAVLHHHEQWNGRGYPLGLSRTDIPLIARILAVADAYDAMTSDRPYRNGMPDERVFEIFREGTAQHWDPEVLEAFFRAKEDIRQIRERERPQIDTFRQHLI